MTQTDFHQLLSRVNDLSPDQMRRLLHELHEKMAALGAPPAPTEAESGDSAARTEPDASAQEVQRRLFRAGLLTEIKPPIRDLTPYRDRKAVPIEGEPLSETVLRERR